MAYSYTPFANENSIRLLHLEPGFDGTRLQASLSVHDLDGQFSYDALSYVWGNPDLNKSLSIDEQELRITYNLHTSLRHLRYPDRVRTLWIDAICINQQDLTEKGPQVALMGRIYRQADTVFAGSESSQQIGCRRYNFFTYSQRKHPDTWSNLRISIGPSLGMN